jgi:hypothetical protein
VLAVGNRLGVVIGHEVEIKVGVRVLKLVDHLHAEKLVELEGSLRLHMEFCQIEFGNVMGMHAESMFKSAGDECLRP